MSARFENTIVASVGSSRKVVNINLSKLNEHIKSRINRSSHNSKSFNLIKNDIENANRLHQSGTCLMNIQFHLADRFL